MSDRGAWAEDAAAAFLVKRGLKLLERNYRCRFGEIDLVLRDARTLVFVEVRYSGTTPSVMPAKALPRASGKNSCERRAITWPRTGNSPPAVSMRCC